MYHVEDDDDDEDIIDLVDSPLPSPYRPAKPPHNSNSQHHPSHLTNGFYTDDGEFYSYDDFDKIHDNKTNNKTNSNTTNYDNKNNHTTNSTANSTATTTFSNNKSSNTATTTTTTSTTSTNSIDRDVQQILQIFPDCDVEYLRSQVLSSTSLNRAQEITDSFLEKRDYKRAKVEEKRENGFSLEDATNKDYYNTTAPVNVLYADTWCGTPFSPSSLLLSFLSFYLVF
jgi:hypothetical protein